MKPQIFIICINLFVFSVADVGDKSFREMCQFWGGTDYKERGAGAQIMRGDTCSMIFQVGMGDREAAIRYCEDQVPYHITDVVVKEYETICKAEATLKCEDGWVQMFGRCYKLQKQMMTRDNAVKFCKTWNKKATIAFMHREALPFRVRDYFTQVSRVWMDASETVTAVLEHNTGPNLLLALDGYKYSVPNNAFAQVPVDETAMALCEYTPDMTQAESTYLLKKYGEIYYPTILTSDRAYVRSTSSYQRSEIRTRDHDICKAILRPFLGTDVIAQAAYPSLEFMDSLSDVRDATIIRTSVYSGDADKFNRKNDLCTESIAKNYGFDHFSEKDKTLFKTITKDLWASGQPVETCDAAYWSTGIVMSRDDKRRLETMSDARYAPIYCQTNFEAMGYGDCPTGYTEYWREERGQKWCHKFINRRSSYDEAKKYCAALDGSFISGFDDEKELFLLDKLFDDAIASGTKFEMNGFWVNARRRMQCTKEDFGSGTGFNRIPDHPCSRERVFEWMNGVAQNPPKFSPHWISEREPNHSNSNEACIEVRKGKQPNWDDMDGSRKLNDIPCSNLHHFFCGKEAPIVSKGLHNQ